MLGKFPINLRVRLHASDLTCCRAAIVGTGDGPAGMFRDVALGTRKSRLKANGLSTYTDMPRMALAPITIGSSLAGQHPLESVR